MDIELLNKILAAIEDDGLLWFAVDSSGCCYGFLEKPGNTDSDWQVDNMAEFYIGKYNGKQNWRKSLKSANDMVNYAKRIDSFL